MRIVAILASYNEEAFVRACFANYFRNGVEVYLIDNESTDRTVEIARSYLGQGLIDVETMPRPGSYVWEPILRRKEEVADELRADWYIHADMDELRCPPAAFHTMAKAFAEADRAGYSTVNFKNFLFLPTQESPDHERSDFPETMLWYRYMEPSYPNQVKAWKSQRDWSVTDRVKRLASGPEAGANTVELVRSGGHKAEFPGATLSPTDFIMKHYQVLSYHHAVRKYVEKHYSSEELARGWHGWKSHVQAVELRLPSQREMRRYTSDAELDTSDPITRTLIYAPEPAQPAPAR